jgi:hypothetical protein
MPPARTAGGWKQITAGVKNSGLFCFEFVKNRPTGGVSGYRRPSASTRQARVRRLSSPMNLARQKAGKVLMQVNQ